MWTSPAMYSVSKYKQYAIILLCVYREREKNIHNSRWLLNRIPTVLLSWRTGMRFIFFLRNKTQRCTDMLTWHISRMMIITIAIYRCKAIWKLSYTYNTCGRRKHLQRNHKTVKKEKKERDRDEIGGTKWLYFFIIITTTFQGQIPLLWKKNQGVNNNSITVWIHLKIFQRCRNMVRV